jgi:predicted metalloprotease with PDZ domain
MRIRYTLAMPDPGSHLFQVRVDVQGAPGDRVDFVLPSWTPGSYKIRDYARHVQDFDAPRRDWRKVEKNRWRVLGGGDVSVEYAVWAFELGVQSCHLDVEHGYVNGAGVFMYVDGLKDVPVEVDIRAPRGWRVATGLKKRGRLWAAPGYDVLIDCPIEIGTFTKRTFRVKGVPHHWVEHGPANHDPDRLLADVRRLVETEVKIMRHIPYDDYTFIVHNSPERGGGLEHLNSTSLQVPPTSYRPREKYDNFLELVAHEFWHLWNVKRIKPEMLGPFDYEKEVYTSLLWVMEGLTSYYDTIVPCRARLFTPEKYFKRMAERMQKYEDKPGRLRQSLSASSFDTWIKLYQPNDNAINCQMSYYEKGELVGMCLDLEIRRRTSNRLSLDDVMRLVYEEWGRDGRGFPEGEFRRACERVAGGSLERFWADYVDGTAEIPWNRFLAVAGCRLQREPRKPEEGEAPRRERPWIGVGTTRAGAHLSVASVTEGSPAWKAGLSVKDDLVALDGARIVPEDWEKRVDELEPGDRVRLTLFRNGFLRELPLVVGARENAAWVIRRVEHPTEAQRRVYESWLWNPWPKGKK